MSRDFSKAWEVAIRFRPLSPAYDHTPTGPASIERRDLALICGNAELTNAANMFTQCARFMFSEVEAAKIIEDMKYAVRDTRYATARGRRACRSAIAV